MKNKLRKFSLKLILSNLIIILSVLLAAVTIIELKREANELDLEILEFRYVSDLEALISQLSDVSSQKNLYDGKLEGLSIVDLDICEGKKSFSTLKFLVPNVVVQRCNLYLAGKKILEGSIQDYYDNKLSNAQLSIILNEQLGNIKNYKKLIPLESKKILSDLIGLASVFILITSLILIALIFYLSLSIRKDFKKLKLKQISNEYSKKFQELVIETMPDFVFVKDKHFRIVQANPAFLNAYSSEKRDKVIGSTTFEEYSEKEAEGFLYFDKKAFEEGYSETEETAIFPDGQERTLHTKKVKFIDELGEEFILCMSQDITDLKEAQDSLIMANSELEEFAYRTSHDLRSPLISSISLLEVVDEALKSQDIERTEFALSQVNKSLRKLEVLIGDILSVTKIKHFEENQEELNIQELINDSLEKFAYMDNFNRLAINKDFQYSQTIKSKPTRVRLIIENLISNAIKYQDENKKFSFIKIKTYQKSNFMVLEIEDNGLGVPENQRKNMFKMFKRFHTKVSFGSGLGLYMMKKSAEMIKGKLRYEDNGHGSTFYLEIPM